MVSIKDLGTPEPRKVPATPEERQAELASRIAELGAHRPYALPEDEKIITADRSAMIKDAREHRAFIQALRKDAARRWYAKTESWALIVAILALLVSMVGSVLPYFLEHPGKALECWVAIKSFVLSCIQ